MTKEKMSVHKALVELKTMDDRISKAMMADVGQEHAFVATVRHSNTKICGVSIDDFKNSAKSRLQKVNDLINRRNAIKRAVVLSNAQTKIVCGGTEYTVAEAIDMKNTGIEYLRELARALSNEVRSAQIVTSSNAVGGLEARATEYVTNIIAAQPKESKMSIDSEEIVALKKKYIDDNTYDIIDPIGAVNVIAELEEKFTSFMMDVDAALSVSNAVTMIDIEY